MSRDIADYLTGTDWSVHLGELDLSKVDETETGTYEAVVHPRLVQLHIGIVYPYGFCQISVHIVAGRHRLPVVRPGELDLSKVDETETGTYEAVVHHGRKQFVYRIPRGPLSETPMQPAAPPYRKV